MVELAKSRLIQAIVLLHPSFITSDDIKGKEFYIPPGERSSSKQAQMQFHIIGPANINVLHVRVYPHIGIEKTLNCPLNDGTQMSIFVSHHYFAKLG
ncbi:hypothetical protein TSUD_365440 [Trifolium subterraneum]|uniref:Uncharacterized protein n=1 Tax=Trifolium subterraneum TaxID=3900 RepID=A0A2Z6N6E8_TRISU|nr:hypothetical protein TSUD_365440 [Trifolium subterraneum]